MRIADSIRRQARLATGEVVGEFGDVHLLPGLPDRHTHQVALFVHLDQDVFAQILCPGDRAVAEIDEQRIGVAEERSRYPSPGSPSVVGGSVRAIRASR